MDPKTARIFEILLNSVVAVLGIALAVEGIFSFVAGAHIPLWELLLQLILSGALFRIGTRQMIEL